MFKLLIVEDEDEIRNSLANYFPWNQIGYEVAASFPNGKQAFEYILQNQVDAVLSDVKMPVMDGIELAKAISERNLPVKIVFLSAFQDFDYLQQSMVYGARNYILKPTKYDDLVAVFTKLTTELASPDVKAEPEDGSNRKKLIEIIKARVLEDLSDCSLSTVSKSVYLTPSYVSTLFKKETGINFAEYALSEKMRYAAELLATGDLKMNAISEMTGYSDTKNFMRAFRNFYGKSPGRYRREIRL